MTSPSDDADSLVPAGIADETARSKTSVLTEDAKMNAKPRAVAVNTNEQAKS
jgi:hypothetical protein